MVKYSKKPGKKRAIRKQPSKKGKRSGKSPRRSRLLKAVKKRRKTKLRGAGLNKITQTINNESTVTHVIIENTSSPEDLNKLTKDKNLIELELVTGLSDANNDVKNIFYLAEYFSYLLYLCANFSEQINEFIEMKNNQNTAFPGLSEVDKLFKGNFKSVTAEEINDSDTYFEFNYVGNLYYTGNTNSGGARSKTEFRGGGLHPTFRQHLLNVFELCDRWLQTQNQIEIFTASGQDDQSSSLQTDQNGIKKAIFSPAIFNILSRYTFYLETKDEKKAYGEELFDVCTKIFLFRYSDDYDNPNTYHQIKEEINRLLFTDPEIDPPIYSFMPTVNVLLVDNREAIKNLRTGYFKTEEKKAEYKIKSASMFLPPPPGHRHQGKFFKVTRNGVDTTELFTRIVNQGETQFVPNGGVYSPPIQFKPPPPPPPPAPPPPAPPPAPRIPLEFDIGPPPQAPPPPPVKNLAGRVIHSNSAIRFTNPNPNPPPQGQMLYGNPSRPNIKPPVLYGNPAEEVKSQDDQNAHFQSIFAGVPTYTGDRHAAVSVTPQPRPVPRVRPCNTFKTKEPCEGTGYCDWLEWDDGQKYCLGKE